MAIRDSSSTTLRRSAQGTKPTLDLEKLTSAIADFVQNGPFSDSENFGNFDKQLIDRH